MLRPNREDNLGPARGSTQCRPKRTPSCLKRCWASNLRAVLCNASLGFPKVQRAKAPLRVERGRAGWVGQSPLRRDQMRL